MSAVFARMERSMSILAHQFRHVSSENNRPDLPNSVRRRTSKQLWAKTRQGSRTPPSCHQTSLLVVLERRETRMYWTSPTLVEICIGLEINGYLPAEF